MASLSLQASKSLSGQFISWDSEECITHTEKTLWLNFVILLQKDYLYALISGRIVSRITPSEYK
jgi:hypothetical protein